MLERRDAGLRGFTLVEVLLSMSVMALLMGGLATAIVLAGRAIPDAQSPATATMEGQQVLERLAEELFCAQTVTLRMSTKIAFTVADRDQDGNPESILYEWQGIPGEALLRTYNGGTPRVVADDVQEFDLSYGVRTEIGTTTQNQTATSAETLLASFDGWVGITPVARTHPISVSNWESEYFEVVPPAGTTDLLFTRALVILTHGGTAPSGISVGIHRSKNDGTYDPASTPIGSPAVVAGGALTSMAVWIPATLSGTKVTDPNRTDYCLVVKGLDSTPALLHYHYDSDAPDNGMVQRWTTDGGASWNPPSGQLSQQDIRFYVYGSFVSTTTQTVQTTREFLTWITIALRISPESSAAVRTSVRVLNDPELPTI